MKTNKYLLFPIALIISSCYLYKPYTEKSVEDLAKQSNSGPVVKSIRNEKSTDQANEKVRIQQGKPELSPEEREVQIKKETEREQQKKENANSSSSKSDGTTSSLSTRNTNKGGEIVKSEEPKPKETGIKGKLEPNKYYKINALGNQYKIQVDKWEGDTLVSHKIRQPKKVYRHHMNDIEEETILERRFSKPFSDLLTVGAYASGAAIVLLLVL